MILTLFTDNLVRTANVLRLWTQGAEPVTVTKIQVFHSEEAGVIASSVNPVGTIDATKIPIDTFNDLAVTTAKAYSDGVVTEVEAKAIEVAETKAAEAEARAITAAETKAAAAEVSAKAYSDGIVTEAESRAIDAAEAKANWAQVEAQAYADGIVTAEEQRAIDDAYNKYQAALAHTENWSEEGATRNTGALADLDFINYDQLGETIIDPSGFIQTGLLGARYVLVGDLKGLAYKDVIGNDDITFIDGGKVTTGIIQSASRNLKFDLTNNILDMLNDSAKIRFGSNSDIIINGSTTQIRMEYGSTGVFNYLQTSTAGFKAYARSATTACEIVGDGYDLSLIASRAINIDAGSSNAIRLKAGGISYYHDGYSFRPSVNQTHWLGTDTMNWHSVYAYRYLTNSGWIYDTEDDLTVLANVQPQTDDEGNIKLCPNNSKVLLDFSSIPDYLTNKEELREQIKKENGNLISDEDFEEMILDEDELGFRVMRDLTGFLDLTSGAVRQMDQEITEDITEQFNSIIEDLIARTALLEKQNADLLTRIETMETATNN